MTQLILQTERLEVTRQVFELDPDKSLQRELLLLKVCLLYTSLAACSMVMSLFS